MTVSSSFHLIFHLHLRPDDPHGHVWAISEYIGSAVALPQARANCSSWVSACIFSLTPRTTSLAFRSRAAVAMANSGLLVGRTTGWTCFPTCSATVTILVSRSRSPSSMLVSCGVTPSVRAGKNLAGDDDNVALIGVDFLQDFLQHRQASRPARGDQNGLGMLQAE